jgi:hypothetical protein
MILSLVPVPRYLSCALHCIVGGVMDLDLEIGSRIQGQENEEKTY